MDRAVTDSTGGSGLLGYQVSRGGVLLATTQTPQYPDETVAAGASVTYSIVAFDRHGNTATAATKAVTVPTTGTEQRRVGVRGTGSYWGAAGEQIDLLSGNLNFSLPLLGAKGRGGLGMGLMLSYNSQMWRQEAGASWKLGQDVGYGLGWRLQAGSVFPVWYNGALLYCIFTDATGAEYRLDQAGSSGLYTSKEGVYLTYDAGAQILAFPDGSRWAMYAQSSGMEDDGGTLYPVTLNDTNGNFIALSYLPGVGSVAANSSARISAIEDGRALAGSGGYVTYQFSYAPGTVPHLAGITNVIGTAEAYTFGYGGVSVASPFDGSVPGALTNLALGKAAAQSSTNASTIASRAVDGNTDGDYTHGSLSATNVDANAWWQVDLGTSGNIGNVEVWNRTDCCGGRLSDYWVFVSDTPFLSSDTPGTLASRAGTWSSHQTSQPNPSAGITVGGYQGRYVRVQLSGTDQLALGEVKVNGTNTTILQSVTTTGLGTAHRFGYNGSGEMTSLTTPLGERWDGATRRMRMRRGVIARCGRGR